MIANKISKLSILGLCSFSLIASGGTLNSSPNIQGLLVGPSADANFSGKINQATSTDEGILLKDDDQIFSLQKNQTGGFDGVLDGKSFSMSGSDWVSYLKAYVKISPGASPTDALLLSSFDLMHDGNSGYSYSDVVFASRISSLDIHEDAGYGAIGLETTDMPDSGTVTLLGNAEAYINLKTNEHFGNKFNADVSITASFATNTLNGSISNISDSSQSYPGQLDITQGVITGHQYTADLTGDAALNSTFDDDVTGHLEGGFYGGSAAETAGKFTIDTDKHVGVGGFRAK